jgi:hypothetical protein
MQESQFHKLVSPSEARGIFDFSFSNKRRLAIRISPPDSSNRKPDLWIRASCQVKEIHINDCDCRMYTMGCTQHVRWLSV